jgi:hypothetical protein
LNKKRKNSAVTFKFGYNIDNGNKALIDIENATVLAGLFPLKQLKLILAWCEIHKEELLENWKFSQEYEKINKIEPLR